MERVSSQHVGRDLINAPSSTRTIHTAGVSRGGGAGGLLQGDIRQVLPPWE